MNIVVIGLNHQTAPISLLERVALHEDGARDLAVALCRRDEVLEAACLATCNRLEVYAVVEAFHPGVDAVLAAVHEVTGVSLAEHPHDLLIRFGADAVRHVFSVAAGLESMAVGESQILGQMRRTLQTAQAERTAGRFLDPMLQRALRVAKRVHHETAIGTAGPTLVSAALSEAEHELGPLGGVQACVVGAGAMSGLVLATLTAMGCDGVTVINRSDSRAGRLVEQYGGTWVPLGDTSAVQAAICQAQVTVSCTGATGYVITPEMFADSATAGDGCRRVLIDLALPRDISPEVDNLPGVRRVDLEVLQALLRGASEQESISAARELVAAEVSAFVSEYSAETIGPTLAALQRRAEAVVDEEMTRLSGRLSDAVTSTELEEIRITLRRVTNKLLHTPTVRMKALAAERESAPDYVSAVQNLFDLHTAVDMQLTSTPSTPEGRCRS